MVSDRDVNETPIPAAEPSSVNAYHQSHIALLSRSLRLWTGQSLVGSETVDLTTAREIFEAPFALVSHGVEKVPVFNYGNRTALGLFEMEWVDFIALPSHLSAESESQAERNKLMERVTRHGYVDDYSGVRISARGRRFHIDQATVWNMIDESGVYRGRAALFDSWNYV